MSFNFRSIWCSQSVASKQICFTMQWHNGAGIIIASHICMYIFVCLFYAFLSCLLKYLAVTSCIYDILTKCSYLQREAQKMKSRAMHKMMRSLCLARSRAPYRHIRLYIVLSIISYSHLARIFHAIPHDITFHNG